MTPGRIVMSLPPPSPAEIPVGGRFGAMQVIVDMLPDSFSKPEPAPPPPIAELEYLTVADMARRYGVSVSAIRKWRSRNLLPPAVMIGDLPRWHVADLEKWERDRKERVTTGRAGMMRVATFPVRGGK